MDRLNRIAVDSVALESPGFDETLVIDFNDLAKGSHLPCRITIAPKAPTLSNNSKMDNPVGTVDAESNADDENDDSDTIMFKSNGPKDDILPNIQTQDLNDSEKYAASDEQFDESIDSGDEDLPREDVDDMLEDELLREPDEETCIVEKRPRNADGYCNAPQLVEEAERAAFDETDVCDRNENDLDVDGNDELSAKVKELDFESVVKEKDALEHADSHFTHDVANLPQHFNNVGALDNQERNVSAEVRVKDSDNENAGYCYNTALMADIQDLGVENNELVDEDDALQDLSFDKVCNATSGSKLVKNANNEGNCLDKVHVEGFKNSEGIRDFEDPSLENMISEYAGSFPVHVESTNMDNNFDDDRYDAILSCDALQVSVEPVEKKAKKVHCNAIKYQERAQNNDVENDVDEDFPAVEHTCGKKLTSNVPCSIVNDGGNPQSFVDCGVKRMHLEVANGGGGQPTDTCASSDPQIDMLSGENENDRKESCRAKQNNIFQATAKQMGSKAEHNAFRVEDVRTLNNKDLRSSEGFLKVGSIELSNIVRNDDSYAKALLENRDVCSDLHTYINGAPSMDSVKICAAIVEEIISHVAMTASAEEAEELDYVKFDVSPLKSCICDQVPEDISANQNKTGSVNLRFPSISDETDSSLAKEGRMFDIVLNELVKDSDMSTNGLENDVQIVQSAMSKYCLKAGVMEIDLSDGCLKETNFTPAEVVESLISELIDRVVQNADGKAEDENFDECSMDQDSSHDTLQNNTNTSILSDDLNVMSDVLFAEGSTLTSDDVAKQLVLELIDKAVQLIDGGFIDKYPTRHEVPGGADDTEEIFDAQIEDKFLSSEIVKPLISEIVARTIEGVEDVGMVKKSGKTVVHHDDTRDSVLDKNFDSLVPVPLQMATMAVSEIVKPIIFDMIEKAAQNVESLELRVSQKVLTRVRQDDFKMAAAAADDGFLMGDSVKGSAGDSAGHDEGTFEICSAIVEEIVYNATSVIEEQASAMTAEMQDNLDDLEANVANEIGFVCVLTENDDTVHQDDFKMAAAAVVDGFLMGDSVKGSAGDSAGHGEGTFELCSAIVEEIVYNATSVIEEQASAMTAEMQDNLDDLEANVANEIGFVCVITENDDTIHQDDFKMAAAADDGFLMGDSVKGSACDSTGHGEGTFEICSAIVEDIVCNATSVIEEQVSTSTEEMEDNVDDLEANVANEIGFVCVLTENDDTVHQDDFKMAAAADDGFLMGDSVKGSAGDSTGHGEGTFEICSAIFEEIVYNATSIIEEHASAMTEEMEDNLDDLEANVANEIGFVCVLAENDDAVTLEHTLCMEGERTGFGENSGENAQGQCTDEMSAEDEQRLLEDDLLGDDVMLDGRIDLDEECLLKEPLETEESQKLVDVAEDECERLGEIIEDSVVTRASSSRKTVHESYMLQNDERDTSNIVTSILNEIFEYAVGLTTGTSLHIDFCQEEQHEPCSRSVAGSILDEILGYATRKTFDLKRRRQDDVEDSHRVKSSRVEIETSDQIASSVVEEIIDRVFDATGTSRKRSLDDDDTAGSRRKLQRSEENVIDDGLDDFECLTEGDSSNGADFCMYDEDALLNNEEEISSEEFIKGLVDSIFTNVVKNSDKDVIIQDILEDIFNKATKTDADSIGLGTFPLVVEATTIDSKEFLKIPANLDDMVFPEKDIVSLSEIKTEVLDSVAVIKEEPYDNYFSLYCHEDVKPLISPQEYLPSGRPRRSVVRPMRRPSPDLEIPRSKRYTSHRRATKSADYAVPKQAKRQPKPKGQKAPQTKPSKSATPLLKRLKDMSPVVKVYSPAAPRKVVASIPVGPTLRKGQKAKAVVPVSLTRKSREISPPLVTVRHTRSSPTKPERPMMSLSNAARRAPLFKPTPSTSSRSSPLFPTPSTSKSPAPNPVPTARKRTAPSFSHSRSPLFPTPSTSKSPAPNPVPTARKRTAPSFPHSRPSCSGTNEKVLQTARKRTAPAPSTSSLKRPLSSVSPSPRPSTRFTPSPSPSRQSTRFSPSPVSEPEKKLMRSGFMPARKMVRKNVALKSTATRPVAQVARKRGKPYVKTAIPVTHDHSYHNSSPPINRKRPSERVAPDPEPAAKRPAKEGIIVMTSCFVSLHRNPVIERLLPTWKKQDNEPNVCELCEPVRVFTSKQGLVHHLQEEHTTALSHQPASNNDRCAGCDRKYFSPKRLLEHMRTCPAVAALPSTSKLPVADLIQQRLEEKKAERCAVGEAWVGCTYCDIKFSSKHALDMHLLVNHRSEEDPLSSEVGGGSVVDQEVDQIMGGQSSHFASEMVKRSGKIVMRLRRENTSFRCTLCSAIFLKQTDYEEHQLMHDMVYRCRTCPAVFDQKAHLIGHELSHTIKIKQERLSPEIEIIEERLAAPLQHTIPITISPLSRPKTPPKRKTAVAKKSTGTRPVVTSKFPPIISAPRPLRKKAALWLLGSDEEVKK